MRGSLLARFLDRVRVAPGDACWTWAGTKFKSGYGRLHANGRGMRAHRVSWEQANGRPVGEGLVVRHSCDNKLCVRPSHLLEGTHTDNVRDKITRGRDRGPAAEARAKVVCIHGHALEGAYRWNGQRKCRECTLARALAYRRANRDQYNAQARTYYLANAEAIKARTRAYRARKAQERIAA